MVHYSIRPSCQTAPDQEISNTKLVRKAAILGTDFPHLRPTFQVSSGDKVTAGQVLFKDRKHPQIVHVAPFAGTITNAEYGPRRTLSACVIERNLTVIAPHQPGPLDDTTDAAVRHALLARGMWPALRTRPFGRTPDPASKVTAIFVNATQRTVCAPDPHVVLDGQRDAFDRGVTALAQLTDGVVYVCQSKSAPLCNSADRVKVEIFGNTPVSGLSGTHVDRLCPVQSGRQVWTIGYQDVAAIGHLFETGQYSAGRVVSISGPSVKKPKLLHTILGASITDITAEEVATDTHPIALSGDQLTGTPDPFLSRFDDQVTLTNRATKLKRRPWQSQPSRVLSALIPTAALDTALGPRVFPVPLMRALQVGDSETARRLGCLALVEEDVAILSRLCTSGSDYTILLRQVLDDLMEDAS